jgi:hypothetical protein
MTLKIRELSTECSDLVRLFIILLPCRRMTSGHGCGSSQGTSCGWLVR